MPDVRANPSSERAHKVIAAAIAGASEEVIAIRKPVESDVLAANSSQQFSGEILAQFRGPDGIEGVEQWTIGLGSESAIHILGRSPEQVTFNPKAMMQKEVGTKAGICAAIVGREVEAVCYGRRGGRNCADPKGRIELLPEGARGKQTRRE